MHQSADWWRHAVVYQVYIRSFRDTDGDGLGDVGGILAGLDHLADLGVDALWINPWYPSPQADAGYDVADYRDIEPAYGTLADAEKLIDAAHRHGLRVILDIVPNHTSSDHPWFQAALAGDERARARYHVSAGKGPDGEQPPNNWESTFGGPAWTPLPGDPGQWYLHLFAPGQPDLNWTNPEVREEFEDVLRFWFDRGVDGFRIDVAHALAKAEGLPDTDPDTLDDWQAWHPAWDQDEVHEVYQGWRRVADSYDPPRVFVAEAWVSDNERLAAYLRPDELHTAFQFDFLRAPFHADVMRKVVTDAISQAREVGAAPTWVLSNHDVPRHVSRYARTQAEDLLDVGLLSLTWGDEPADLDLGRRRARAALLLTLALPGSAYLYQGEELGLPEVEDIPAERRQDPIFEQSGRRLVGRDGCRVPLPWAGDAPPYDFSPEGATGEPWLPQPDDWAPLTLAAQQHDGDSVLALYRAALRLRPTLWVGAGELDWVDDAPAGVVAFRRRAEDGSDLECWVNAGTEPADLPSGEVLLTSGPADGVLPPATAAWVRR
jgi:alpha-glucosidase